MSKKKIISLCLVVCLLATAIIGGTMAYFTDTDEVANTVVIGNVDISQNEYEYVSADSNAIQTFTNDKPLVPYVGQMSWADESLYYNNGDYNWRRFGIKNAIDKYITVKNEAKEGSVGADAYVRTIIIREVANGKGSMCGISINTKSGGYGSEWVWGSNNYVYHNDGWYYWDVATYDVPLKPGQETEPSLNQVYLHKDATNEIAAGFDANGNGKADIYAVTQAVQVAGFEDVGPAAALNEAHGEITNDVIIEIINKFNT